MKLKQITGLVRLLDPRYPTNLAILLIAAAVGAVALISQLISGDTFWQALGWSLTLGFLTTMSWAIGRELDPDHELAAFVGVILFLLSFLFYNFYLAWPALLLIMALRIVNRSNGLPATWLDAIAITVLAGWLLAGTGHWAYTVVASLALLLDALLPAPSRRHLLFVAIIIAIVLFWQSAAIVDRAAGLSISWLEWLLAGVTAVLFTILIILRSHHLRSLGDATRQPLMPPRVQAAQLLALLTGLLFLWQGADTLLALWSALLGVSLYRIYIITKGKS